MCYLGYAHPLLGISIVSNQLSYLRQSHWRWAMYCILGRLVDVCKRLCRWCLLSVILYHKFEVEDFLLSHYVKQQLLHTHTGIPIRRPLLPHTRNQIAATNLRDTGCVDSVFCQPTCGLCISHTYVGQTINRGVRQIVKYRSPKPSDLEQKETLKAYGVSKTLYNGVVEARLGILVPRWKIRGYV